MAGLAVWTRLLLVAWNALLLLPATATAHATELVGTQKLAIPRWMFFTGAGIVLVLSFAALGRLWTQPRLAGGGQRRIARAPRSLEPLCGAVGIATLVFLVYAGYAGTEASNDNILPTTVFVAFWIGIPILSLFLGDVFRPFNPWRAIGRTVGYFAPASISSVEPLRYPRAMGYYPAAAGLLTFVFFELAFTDRNEPSTLATLVVIYTAVQLVGMACYGVEVWTSRCDAFAVYFRLFASLSPLNWSSDGLSLRHLLSGTARLREVPGTVALLCVMIGSTSFDGFTVSRLWNDLARKVLRFFTDAGVAGTQAGELTFALGLVAVVAVIAALYRLGVAGIKRRDETHSAARLGLTFAPSLVPVALAYVVAHYFGLLTYQGQQLVALVSDPLGRGWNLFGTASVAVDYGLISATVIWYIQVATIVTGHLAGLALAHDRALVLYGDTDAAARSQRWMLGVMVLFTLLALWLLSTLA